MAFLDCNIWEINKFPRYGTKYDRNTIKRIFHYSSDTKEFQSNVVDVQIPEFEIVGSEEEKLFVHKYKEEIIKQNLPIVVHVIDSNGKDFWKLDVRCAERLKYSKQLKEI